MAGYSFERPKAPNPGVRPSAPKAKKFAFSPSHTAKKMRGFDRLAGGMR